MGKITTVLFDFDGTIMDTNGVIIDSWQHTFRTLTGKEGREEDIIRTFGEPLSYTMEKTFPDIPVEEAIGVYRSYHWDNFGERITVFPGIVELLEQLKVRGYSLGLVTSRLKGTTMEGLEKYRLEHFFDAMVTCDDTDRHKPDPEPILIALERLGSAPEESVMVGDTRFDVLCARNAGVASVLVAWQMAMSQEEISGPLGPDHYIETPEELLTILEGEKGE
ncbi:MAG: HAD-IA family hydrolase [Bacillota bacterium]|nr:HAD-IA family hydrolase [Bacillota bacterium]